VVENENWAHANESALDSVKSRGALVNSPPPGKLFNSSLGSVPNFVNSPCVPRWRHCWASMVNVQCSSAVRRMYPFTHALHSDVS